MPSIKLVWLAVSVVFFGCSTDSDDDTGGAGGAPTTGGAAGVATGGSQATGGSATGGDQATGGLTTGGTATGGDPGTGGAGGAAGAGTGGSATGGAAGSGGAPSCALTDSGPITVTTDGQVVELLRITSTSGAAIDVQAANVVIRNVEILHDGGPGIDFANADNLRIENVSIEFTGAPASGENPSSDYNNISGYASADVTITGVRLTRGSSGIYLNQCPRSTLTFVEGHDFRGPFPRGQLAQWDNSDDGLLEDFSVENPSTSWPEDNVNVYQSQGLQIRRGFIDGNNSPTGVGVIFDGGDGAGVVEDVDAIHMGNGCFSDYAGAEGVIFRRTRCRDNVCTDQGRGLPSSNALMWCGNTAHTAIQVLDSHYYGSCNGNVVWPTASFSVLELTEEDFTPRSPIRVALCWEG